MVYLYAAITLLFIDLGFRSEGGLLFLGSLGVRFRGQKTQGGHCIPGGVPAVQSDGGLRGTVQSQQSDHQYCPGPQVPPVRTELEVSLCHTEVHSQGLRDTLVF